MIGPKRIHHLVQRINATYILDALERRMQELFSRLPGLGLVPLHESRND